MYDAYFQVGSYEVITAEDAEIVEETMIVEGYVEEMEEVGGLVMEDGVMEEIVEEDGIKYETEYVTI